MIEKLEEIVKKNKDKIAYIVSGESITYGMLWNKAGIYADYLKRQGNDPVLLYGHKSINMFISIVACLISKRPYVPVDVSVPRERIQKIIALTKASLVIKNEDVNNFEIETLKLEELEKYKNAFEKECNSAISYIIFTSGSTGEPKGVPISALNLENFISWITSLLKEDKQINVLNTANFNFDLSVADIYYALFNGHTLIVNENLDYETIFKNLQKVNLVVATPTFMKMCLLNENFKSDNFKSLETIYFCGERLEKRQVKKLFDRFPNIKVINAYGPTEATSAVCASVITKEMLNCDMLPVGDINSAAVNIDILNEEIVLRGASVFSGYLNNIKGGYFKDNGENCYLTGDLGYIKDGKLYCLGRRDNQIKYKGYRIELEEIENVISKINVVNDVCVIPKYNEEGLVKLIKAYIVGNVNKENITTYLKDKLPEYMIPKSFEFLDKLPVNSNGKIDRKRLSDL